MSHVLKNATKDSAFIQILEVFSCGSNDLKLQYLDLSENDTVALPLPECSSDLSAVLWMIYGDDFQKMDKQLVKDSNIPFSDISMTCIVLTFLQIRCLDFKSYNSYVFI